MKCSILKIYQNILRNLLNENSQTFFANIEIKLTQKKVVIKSFINHSINTTKNIIILFVKTFEKREIAKEMTITCFRVIISCAFYNFLDIRQKKHIFSKFCLIDLKNNERYDFDENDFRNHEIIEINVNRFEIREIIKQFETTKLFLNVNKIINASFQLIKHS